MTESLKSFEELECWKACTEVRRYISDLLKKYPKDEKFTLVDDMKRAARSTTHNIAEGFGRFHYQENVQFCRISRGSLYELIDQLITSKALALLNGYINYLSKSKSRLTINK